MAAKTTPEHLVTLEEIRVRTGILFPPVEQFLERFGDVKDAESLIVVDSLTGKRAVPESLARSAIERYEEERTEGVRQQREYEVYRRAKEAEAQKKLAAQAEKERQARLEADEKASAAYRRQVAERERQRTAHYGWREENKKITEEQTGKPLDFTAWQRKGKPPK